MKPFLQLALHQQLTLSPQLRQAIRLLQLSSLELDLEIQTQLGSNPLLEQEEVNGAPDELNEEMQLPFLFYASTDKHDLLIQKSAESTLKNSLLWQMELTSFSERERAIAITVIDAISEEGYLTIPLFDLQDALGKEVSLSEIESVLFKIQQFDPIGVGARDLMECLNLQLNTLPVDTPWLSEAKSVALHSLEALGKRDYNHLKKNHRLNDATLKSVIKILKALNPRPGTKVYSKSSEYVAPDLIVRKKNQFFVVEHYKQYTKLGINPNYASFIQKGDTQGDMMSLKTHLKEARWFLKSLKIRQETLIKVGQAIVDHQQAFLEFGTEAMKPLSLQDIANAIGVHESTVSRITTQKYLLTSRGIFELKFFFSNLIPQTSGNRLSSTAIQAFIKKMIANEDRENPLNDDQINECLRKQNIHITRRTVANYRKTLNILPSHERRMLFINPL